MLIYKIGLEIISCTSIYSLRVKNKYDISNLTNHLHLLNIVLLDTCFLIGIWIYKSELIYNTVLNLKSKILDTCMQIQTYKF